MSDLTVKRKCGILAIGAGGGNVGTPFYQAGYPSLFVNSAKLDLDSLTEVDEKYKYHIPGGEGCNKETGIPLDTFIGYEADATICILVGLSLPYAKMAEIKEIIDSNKDTIKRNLTVQSKGKLSEGLGFFDDIIPTNKPKTEKKTSNRDLLF